LIVYDELKFSNFSFKKWVIFIFSFGVPFDKLLNVSMYFIFSILFEEFWLVLGVILFDVSLYFDALIIIRIRIMDIIEYKSFFLIVGSPQ